MKVAICVGHSRSGDDGAVSVDGVDEWDFNVEIANGLYAVLKSQGHQPHVLNVYSGNTYSEAMADAARRVRAVKADVAIELHFNSSDNEKANGHEWLYWNSSAKSKTLAHWLGAMFDELPLFSRGILPRYRSDRGALFLRLTHCPAVICEPFFGSNKKDWSWASKNQRKIIFAIADALEGYQEEVAR